MVLISRKKMMLPSFITSALQVAQIITGTPIDQASGPRNRNIHSALPNHDFPDPSIIQNPSDGLWYAFGTSTTNGPNVQVASSKGVDGRWNLLPNDLLPTVGAWSTGNLVWAPDVRIINSQYVLYYTAQAANSTNQHCAGAATSSTILGPYKPLSDPLACNTAIGGAIDPSGFTDTDGRVYIVYKVDGNSIGHGGVCGNSIEPIIPTPIMLQELSPSDGTTPLGPAIQILDRSDADGPLIEAPNLIKVDDMYFLFFSSNCFSTPQYDISYAYADVIEGPWTKADVPLLVTGSLFNLTAPGGATATGDGGHLAFHADCPAGRCAFEVGIEVDAVRKEVRVRKTCEDVMWDSLMIGVGIGGSLPVEGW